MRGPREHGERLLPAIVGHVDPAGAHLLAALAKTDHRGGRLHDLRQQRLQVTHNDPVSSEACWQGAASRLRGPGDHPDPPGRGERPQPDRIGAVRGGRTVLDRGQRARGPPVAARLYPLLLPAPDALEEHERRNAVPRDEDEHHEAGHDADDSHQVIDEGSSGKGPIVGFAPDHEPGENREPGRAGGHKIGGAVPARQVTADPQRPPDSSPRPQRQRGQQQAPEPWHEDRHESGREHAAGTPAAWAR